MFLKCLRLKCILLIPLPLNTLVCISLEQGILLYKHSTVVILIQLNVIPSLSSILHTFFLMEPLIPYKVLFPFQYRIQPRILYCIYLPCLLSSFNLEYAFRISLSFDTDNFKSVRHF